VIIQGTDPDDIISDIMKGLFQWCEIFNSFSEVLFGLLKYILIFMLFMIGYMTLRKYRGFFRGMKLREQYMDEEEKLLKEKLRETSTILGIFYIALGVGILIGYLTHLLAIVLDPIPDAFIFDFINFAGKIPEENMQRIMNLELAEYAWEKSIYYCIAYSSFLGFVGVIMGLRFMIMYANKTHTTSFKLFIMGLIDCIFCGFTTFMPLFM